MTSPAELDRLMHRGWPGLATVDVDGWVVRLAAGVTARANSVLPVRPPRDLDAALAAVETLFRERGLAPAFQISPAAQPPALDALLSERRYERRTPTLVQTATVGRVMQRLAPSDRAVAVADAPDEDWMDCWWSVDGRGGLEERAIAQRILLSCPALYVTMHDKDGVAATGRIALAGTWGGVYCMTVREDARHRGHGTTILRALVEEGAKRSIRHVWLQVVEANRDARALYERAGFVSASRYHYRVQ
ncbi:MAG: hypothetical protein NVS4B2_12810 [Chloroflexota bacterium]